MLNSDVRAELRRYFGFEHGLGTTRIDPTSKGPRKYNDHSMTAVSQKSRGQNSTDETEAWKER